MSGARSVRPFAGARREGDGFVSAFARRVHGGTCGSRRASSLKVVFYSMRFFMKSTAPLVRVEVEYHRHRMATASSHSQPHSRSSDSIAHCGALRGLSPLALNALNRCLFALALPVDFRIVRIESPSEPHGSDPMDGPNERRVRGPRLQIRGRAGASGGVTSALAAWAGPGASLHAAQGPRRGPLAAVSPLGNASPLYSIGNTAAAPS